jgi:hypothetical protein
MSRFGFVGASYRSQAVNADCQTCMNWYVENDESGDGSSARMLYPTPGLKLFADLVGAQVRGEWTINGRTFGVCDATLYEVLSNGTKSAIGAVNNDGNPASIVASPQQLLVASGGFLYVYYLRTVGAVVAGTYATVPPTTFPGPVTQVAYSDGFFIALIASTEQFFVSTPLDATSWPGLQTKIISTFPDNVVSMIVDHRQIWLLGAKASEVQYDSGNSPVPFDSAPGGFVEQGCGAAFATVQLDNSIFWIGSRNDQGGGVAWRASGYTPTRVSTHAVELAWQSYPTIADARAFSYQDQGHSFWQINFPSANATWVYDVATGLWHERGFWFAQAGIFQAALPQCHTFNFGKHLVGDRQSGKIYQMAIPARMGGAWDFVTDNGNPIRRVRRAPHVSTEQEWMVHAQLQVDFETGLGPQPPLEDGAGNPRDPMATLRYSDDGGHTWSNGQDRGCGQAGKFRTRAMWRRLGRARDRVYELSVSDPIPWRVVDAYLKASPNYEGGQERLSKKLSKVA